MSSMTNIFGEDERVRITRADDPDDLCIWIRTRNETVSLNLTSDQFRVLAGAIAGILNAVEAQSEAA